MLRASRALAHRPAAAWALVPRTQLHCGAIAPVRALAACSHAAPLQHSSRHGSAVASTASCRSLSTAAAAAPAQPSGGGAGSNKYSHTMLLPRTSFPQHVRSIAERERDLSARYCGPNLYRWQQQARASHDRSRTFVLHDGPPFANGRLHMGHFLNKVLKDIVNRYKLMRGFRVHYVPGWDCHGMPIEVKALELLKSQQQGAVEGKGKSKGKESDSSNGGDGSASMSPTEIRSLASRFAQGALEEQRRDFSRWGIMGAWDAPYSTMAPSYEAAQLGVFGKLVQRGLVFRGLKPVYWSPASRTALAEAELEYKDDHASTSLYLSFPVESFGTAAREAGLDLGQLQGLGVLAWTTTPWTLPSNQALCFHPELRYAVVRVGAKDEAAVAAAAAAAAAAAEPVKKGQPKPKDLTEEGEGLEGRLFLVGVARLPALESLLNRRLSILHEFPGSALEGSSCAHPFLPRSSPLIPGSHVTTEGGSCLVHTAPGHGVEDFQAARAAGIEEVLCPVDGEGFYTPELVRELPELAGQNVLRGASKSVVNLVRTRGSLVHTSRMVHRYPYDWRSKTPVILRATEQWFCRLDSIAPAAVEALRDQVRLVPPSGLARLTAMISTRKEWCISRQRHWGVPIPVFYHKQTGAPLLTPESVAHVQGLVAQHGTDCWWSLPLSELLPPSLQSQSEQYERGADTMDVWFDSGCSWRAVVQDPLLGLGDGATADVYLEGSDQHRGWFQSSLLTAVSATDCAPYKTILTHGFVLDEQQRKMSKSIGNVLDPNTLINGVPSASIEDAPAPPAPAAATAATVPAGGKKPPKVKKAPAPGEPLGVDLLRLWVASSDYAGDVSVGKAVLAKMSEAMKKIRPSARFMLGNIDDLTPDGVVPYEQLSQLDRYTLGLLQSYAEGVTAAYESYDFKEVFSLLLSFNSINLSAFVFELAKDRLYAESANSPARRAAQTVLLRALVVLTKSLAPIVPHFAEDVYQHVPVALRPYFHSSSDAAASASDDPAQMEDSVFMHGWLEEASSGAWNDPALAARVNAARRVRSHVTKLLERVRQEHRSIGNFSEAQVELMMDGESQLYRDLDALGNELTALLMTANATLTRGTVTVAAAGQPNPTAHWSRADSDPAAASSSSDPFSLTAVELDSSGAATPLRVSFTPAAGSKCPRCWKFTSDATETEPCCTRCRQVMQQMQAN